MEAAMDAYAANLAKPEPPHVMGGKFDFSKPFALLAKEQFRVSWPPGLFIPGWPIGKSIGSCRRRRGRIGTITDLPVGTLWAETYSIPRQDICSHTQRRDRRIRF